MKRKNALFVLHIAVVLLLVLSDALTAVAQSPAQQQQESTQPKASDNDQDLINPDRPGIADGSAVIGAKRFQIESGFQEEFRRQDQSREHTFFIPTLLRIGISDCLEARVEGNTFTRRSDFDSTNMTNHASGLAPFSVGLKYQITGGELSTGIILRVFPAWGTGDFSTHHVTGDLRVAADWNFAPKLNLSLNPNVGVGVYEDDQGKVFTAGLLAVTLNYTAMLSENKQLNPFIDVGLQAPEESEGKTAIIVDGGVAYVIKKNIQFDASVGTGAHGHTPPHPFISFGVSFRLDRQKK